MLDLGDFLTSLWNLVKSAFGDGANPRAELDHRIVAIGIFERSGRREETRCPDEIAIVVEALKRARPATPLDRWLLVDPTRWMTLSFEDGTQLRIQYGEPADLLHASLVVIRGKAFVVMSPVPPLFRA
jgi:hypothetical protein